MVDLKSTILEALLKISAIKTLEPFCLRFHFKKLKQNPKLRSPKCTKQIKSMHAYLEQYPLNLTLPTKAHHMSFVVSPSIKRQQAQRIKFKITLPANLTFLVPWRRRLIDIQQLCRPKNPSFLGGPAQRTLPTRPIPTHRLLPLPQSKAPEMEPSLAPIAHHRPAPNLRLGANPARAGPANACLAGELRRRFLCWRGVAKELHDQIVSLEARIGE